LSGDMPVVEYTRKPLLRAGWRPTLSAVPTHSLARVLPCWQRKRRKSALLQNAL